ncbi:NACHT domain-containing protein [Cladophialophora immunda]|nr:NACHT domain-containing protein [Cladophialophora immunda]
MAQPSLAPQPKPWETLSPHQEAMIEACKAGQIFELNNLFDEHHVKEGSEPISSYQAKQEGAPATDLLFKAAISHGQQSIVRWLHSMYPTYDFHNPCIVRAPGATRNVDMLKLIHSYYPRIVSYSFDDHRTSMMSLAIAQGPENGPFIHFLLDHGAISMNDGGYLVHGGAELCPAIEYNQPIDVIKKMIPKTRFLISPLLMAIDHKRADAVEVLLAEDHARRRQVGMEDYLQEPLKAAQKTNDKDTIAVVERFIYTRWSSKMRKMLQRNYEPRRNGGSSAQERSAKITQEARSPATSTGQAGQAGGARCQRVEMKESLEIPAKARQTTKASQLQKLKTWLVNSTSACSLGMASRSEHSLPIVTGMDQPIAAALLDSNPDVISRNSGPDPTTVIARDDARLIFGTVLTTFTGSIAKAEANFKAPCDRLKERKAAALDWLQPSVSVCPPLVKWEDKTCEWLLVHPCYIEWTASGYSSPLWIHGIPGCGKTVQANYVINNAFTPSDVPGGIFAHFFQKPTSSASSTPSTLVSSILARIFRNPSLHSSPALLNGLEMITGLASRFNTSGECAFKPLWNILKSAIAHIQNYALVVDGLDECSMGDEFEDLLHGLRDLANLPNARIIILSRFNAKFLALLGSPIAIPMHADIVDADIRVLVEAEVNRNPRLAPISGRLFEKIASKADGIFLWARFIIDWVKDTPTEYIQNNRVATFPPGLTAGYDHFINRTTESLGNDKTLLKLRRELFLLFVGSRRVLNIEEISTVIALNTYRPTLDEGNKLLDPENDMLRLCSPLVVVVGRRVRLIHASVRDYLLRPVTTIPSSSPLYAPVRFDLFETDDYFARKCLSQLILLEFASLEAIVTLLRKNLSIKDKPDLDHVQSETKGFYEYSCLNWHLHLTATPNPSQHTLSLAKKFLLSSIDSGPTVEVRSILSSWLTLLPLSMREKIPIDEFISTSGTKQELGEENPITLRALSALATITFAQGHLKQAAKQHADIGKLQSKIVGEGHRDTLISLSGEGVAYYFLARFAEARNCLERASAGLLTTDGPTLKEYLYNQLYLGYVLE